jgi:hypothetical protein
VHPRGGSGCVNQELEVQAECAEFGHCHACGFDSRAFCHPRLLQAEARRDWRMLLRYGWNAVFWLGALLLRMRLLSAAAAATAAASFCPLCHSACLCNARLAVPNQPQALGCGMPLPL